MDRTIIFLLIISSSIGTMLYFYSQPSKTKTSTITEPPPILNTCDNCKCYGDMLKSASSDAEYKRIEAIDNKTFCGKITDGVLYGCKENCCKDKCV